MSLTFRLLVAEVLGAMAVWTMPNGSDLGRSGRVGLNAFGRKRRERGPDHRHRLGNEGTDPGGDRAKIERNNDQKHAISDARVEQPERSEKECQKQRGDDALVRLLTMTFVLV